MHFNEKRQITTKRTCEKGIFHITQTIQVFFFCLQNTTKASIQHITKTDTIILWCLCNFSKTLIPANKLQYTKQHFRN